MTAILFATSAHAEDAPVPAAGANEREIVVIAARLKDDVDAPQTPVMTLDEQDIASYGASSIGDLLAAISPETSSGRGRGSGGPVILVNGRRIASFRELGNYPSEAIRRVEVLPEEVALRYGYRPDQRVVNFILKDRFSSRTVKAEYSQPDRGGTATDTVKGSLLKLNGNRRFNLALATDHTSPLTEAERNVVQTPGSLPDVAGDPDPASNRTLIGESSNYSADATWTVPVGHGSGAGTLAFNLSWTRNDSTSLLGLNSVRLTDPGGATVLRTLPGALTQSSRTDIVRGSVSLDKLVGSWQLNATLDATHSRTSVHTPNLADTAPLAAAAAAGTLAIDGPLPALPDAGTTTTRSTADSLTSLVTFAGHPLRLPAGEIAATFKAGFAFTGNTASSSDPAVERLHLQRKDASVGVNLGIPLTSRKQGFGGAIGDVTLNVSAGADRLSDFGWLTDWSAGVTWNVTNRLSLQASYFENQEAPPLASLGSPLRRIYNVPVYDFATDQTVLVTTTVGGNRDLPAESQHDIKLGLNWSPPFFSHSILTVDYFDNLSKDITTSFPLLTPAIEAAFPARVERDASGRITAIDQRPIAFARRRESRLRWGFNVFGRIGRTSGAAQKGEHKAHGRARHGGQGRWHLSVYHTVRFVDRVSIAAGGPRLDLLNGDALSSGGGSPRHQITANGGVFVDGIGLRLSGTYSAPTDVRSNGSPGASDLHFGGLFKFDLRVFANLGEQRRLTSRVPFFKGARLSVSVDNVFDRRQHVTDARGTVPLGYQPDYLDPLGRTISVTFRKMF